MINRSFDIILSMLIVLLLVPVFIILPVFILVLDGKPVFFHQKRLGKNSQWFTLTKFRTMQRGESLSPDHDEMRLTNIGKFLRKTSLDELPTFLNVIKGDMSLVGPRPLPVKYLNRFNVFQNRRHEVRPGITGWAQINGRNTLSWEEKFEYDVYYVNHRNIFLDIKILILTLFQILKGREVSPTNQEIMPEFLGTEKNESSDKT